VKKTSPGAESALLSGPILPTLLRLALPNVMTLSLGVMVSIAETAYIGRLGTVPLAAMAIVFPFGMLVQMLSSGAMGGGVSSAIARALGAGDTVRAQRLVLHALAIGALAGLAQMLLMWTLGPIFYRWLGARGPVLDAAIAYGWTLFAAAPAVWLMNAQLSILRGTGNMLMPARVTVLAASLQILVGGALGLGIGPWPGWGLQGVALGTMAGYGCGAVWLALRMSSGRERLRLQWRGQRLDPALFSDILKVGALACLSPLQTIATILFSAALIAPLGTQVLAGYGIGQRLEMLLIPISFGIGVAAVPMVGMAMGAGNVRRARTVAWTAAGVSTVNLTIVGGLFGLFPGLWSEHFSEDPQVLAAAALHLAWIGPLFGFFGFGLTLYFAAQGSGRIGGPVLAASLRLIMVVIAGLTLKQMDAPVWSYFALMGLGMVVYGVACGIAVRLSPWGPTGPGISGSSRRTHPGND
jgi:putative MATE family efflux protein